jgi:methyl-accepting chemotaxis protein
MEEIVQWVKRVTDIMAEISAASQEQREGIEQVNTAIVQMDKVTQQNAALVAAKSMEDQTGSMAQMIAQFRLSDGFGGAPPAPASGTLKAKGSAGVERPFRAVKEPPALVRAARSAASSSDTSRPHRPDAEPSTRRRANGGGDADWKQF